MVKLIVSASWRVEFGFCEEDPLCFLCGVCLQEVLKVPEIPMWITGVITIIVL